MGASTTPAGKVKAKEELRSSYEIKDLGEAKYILGMKIERTDDGSIKLSQRTYSEHVLERFGMAEAKSCSTPLLPGITSSIKDSPETQDEADKIKGVLYCKALGSLIWLQVATHPDLSYIVNLLSRFAHNPGQAHWNALKHALSYMKETLDYGITYFCNSSLCLFGYVDSDYARDVDGQKSMEGHMFFVGGGLVSWASKCQETVALSTVEAEYMAFTQATQQALWLTNLWRKSACHNKHQYVSLAIIQEQSLILKITKIIDAQNTLT